MLTDERIAEMQDNFWAETNDPATEEWRDELTAEEAALVARWDAKVDAGLADLLQANKLTVRRINHAESVLNRAEPQSCRGTGPE